METQIELNEVTIPLEQEYGFLLLEYSMLLAILVGTILLFKYTRRPGTLMMLVGVSIYLLCSLALFPFMEPGFQISGFAATFIHYWPSLHIASIIVSCLGFIRFSWSFRNDG